MIEFEVDGKKCVLRTPNTRDRREARRAYNQVYSQAIADGAPLAKQIMNLLKERGVITDESEAEIRTAETQLDQLLEKLDKGGYELEQAQEDVKEIRKLRGVLLNYNRILNQMMSNTPERQAEEAEKDALLASCLQVDGKPYCKNLDDFYGKSEDPIIISAMIKFNEMMYGDVSAMLESLPENKFLKEYGLDIEEEAPPKEEKKPFTRDGVPVEPKVE